jgi:hypothetical protein
MNENPEGTMARGVKDLIVAQHALFGSFLWDGGHNVPPGKVARKEGDIIYLVATFSYVESP